MRETQTVGLGDTDSIPKSTTQTTSSHVPQEEAKPKGPIEKRPAGKLPQVPNSSKDSQEAAAAMLNKLRKRR